MKLLSTQTHGIVDYLTAGALLVMPRVLGWNKNVSRLLTMAGLGALAYSLFTRYEVGLVKLLPMKSHLAMDAVSGLTLATAPLWLNERNERMNNTLVGIGLFEIMAAFTTETEPRQLTQRSYQQQGYQQHRFQHDGHQQQDGSSQQPQDTPVPHYIPINAGGVERVEEGMLNG
jgi:hypothetical protein